MVGQPEQVLLMEAGGIELDNVQRVLCESEWCVRCVHHSYDFPLPAARRGKALSEVCVNAHEPRPARFVIGVRARARHIVSGHNIARGLGITFTP